MVASTPVVGSRETVQFTSAVDVFGRELSQRHDRGNVIEPGRGVGATSGRRTDREPDLISSRNVTTRYVRLKRMALDRRPKRKWL